MKKNIKVLLLLIVVVGFALRTYFWFYGHSEHSHGTFELDGDDGYLFVASAFDPTNNRLFFDYWRSYYQMVYPLYLAPIFIFGLSISSYIFWLHHFFSAFTTIFIFLTAVEIGNARAGLLAAAVYACQLQIIFWFTWSYSDIAFHFQLALFMYCGLLCWKRVTLRNCCFMAFSGATLSFTRPEGAVIAVISFIVLIFRLYSPRFGVARLTFVFLGTMVVFLVLVASILTKSKVIREAVFSNLHVGVTLYHGSRETPSNPKLSTAKMREMYDYGNQKAIEDLEGRNIWYWVSVAGIERIRNNPLGYVLVLIKRIPSILCPSFFREGVSWRYKLFDRAMFFFFAVGLTCVLMLERKDKFELVGLILMAIPIYVIITFYHSEWDVRIQLSPHVLLVPVAACGWVILLDQCRKILKLPSAGS
jgi:hypothetical protein